MRGFSLTKARLVALIRIVLVGISIPLYSAAMADMQINSTVSVPSDSPNTSTNAGVLGVFTNGNIKLYPDPGGNLTVDGSLAVLSVNTTRRTSGFATPGGSISNWTIVGGRAEDQAHAVSISSGNTYHDTRFGNNFGPPWFPTAVPQPGTLAVPSSEGVAVNRATWAEVNRP